MNMKESALSHINDKAPNGPVQPPVIALPPERAKEIKTEVSAEYPVLKNSLVSCLTATRGRFSVLRDAVACFIAQDYQNKEMIILNNHPTPIVCNLPGVRVYNEPKYPTLGHCRVRLLELATGELVRTWDDDDLYLPWCISQGVEHLGTNAAWKPRYLWHSRKNRIYEYGDNVYEAAWTLRTEVARKFGYRLSGGDEHQPQSEGLQNLMKIEDIGWAMPYVYRWDSGLWRISGTLNNGKTIEERTEEWNENNSDDGEGRELTPSDLSGIWKELCADAILSIGSEAQRLKEALHV